MGNMTLSIPNEIHEEMKQFSEIKWSEVARKAIVDKIEMLHIAEKLTNKSKLTKKDIEDFNKKIKSSATKRFIS